MSKTVAEYIWLDSKYGIRSKTKIIHKDIGTNKLGLMPDLFPIWNFDGSSTGQAQGMYSELFIKPVAVYPDPFFTKEEKNAQNNSKLNFVLVLCETLDKDLNPLPTNNYQKALEIFNKKKDSNPGLVLNKNIF